MSTRMSRTLVCALVLCLAMMSGSSSSSVAQTQKMAKPADAKICGLLPEVRLRRIHLVRPDLIPYPITYQAIC